MWMSLHMSIWSHIGERPYNCNMCDKVQQEKNGWKHTTGDTDLKKKDSGVSCNISAIKKLVKLKNKSAQITFICTYSLNRVQKLIKYEWVTKNSENWVIGNPQTINY